MRKVKGLTLIEMMIALVISLSLLSLLMMIYISAKKNLKLELSLSQLLNNGRTAIDLLQSDIQLAGFIGCAKLTDDSLIKNSEFSAQNKLELRENKISVWHADGCASNLIEDMFDTEHIVVNRDSKFAPRDLLLISDCTAAEVVHVKSVSIFSDHQYLTIEPLSRRFLKYAEINKIVKNTYFVDKTKRQTFHGETIYALYKSDLHGKKVEMVEGVNSINFKKIGETKGIEIVIQLVSGSLIKTWYSLIQLR